MSLHIDGPTLMLSIMNFLRILSVALFWFLGMTYIVTAQDILSPTQHGEVAVNVE